MGRYHKPFKSWNHRFDGCKCCSWCCQQTKVEGVLIWTPESVCVEATCGEDCGWGVHRYLRPRCVFMKKVFLLNHWDKLLYWNFWKLLLFFFFLLKCWCWLPFSIATFRLCADSISLGNAFPFIISTPYTFKRFNLMWKCASWTLRVQEMMHKCQLHFQFEPLVDTYRTAVFLTSALTPFFNFGGSSSVYSWPTSAEVFFQRAFSFIAVNH